MRQAIYFIAKI